MLNPSIASGLRPFRPILLGAGLFLALNMMTLATVIGWDTLNHKLNASLDNHMPGKLSQLQEQSGQKPVDVLFLGTSQTHNGFSTYDFEKAAPVGVNAFNLGMPGARYDVMLTSLKAFESEHGKPRLLMLEVSPTVMESNPQQFYLPALQLRTLLERHPERMTDLLETSPNVRKEVIRSFLSPFYQFRPIFSPLNLQHRLVEKATQLPNRNTAQAVETPVTVSAPESPVRLAKGWAPKAISPTMLSVAGVKQNAAEAKKFYIDSMTTVDDGPLKTLLTYCKARSIPVVLVSWPNHPDFRRHLDASPLNMQYRTNLQRIASDFQFPVIELDSQAELINQPGTFADTRHLSPNGAHRFSALLAKQVFAQPQIARAWQYPKDEDRLARLTSGTPPINLFSIELKVDKR